MNTDVLFSIANLFYLIGTSLLIKIVIKNRNSLNDFDYIGSIMNVIGMLITAYAFSQIKSYYAILMSLPTMAFWAIAAIYSFKNRRQKNGK